MSFYILSSWLTVLSGDFSPGLHHHPFLSIQHPQYKFCDLHSILSHWEVQFQSIHMLPRIPHQESKTFFKFLFDTPMTIILEFLLLPDQKMITLAFKYMSLCPEKMSGWQWVNMWTSWVLILPSGPECNLSFRILAPLQQSQALMSTACSLVLLL